MSVFATIKEILVNPKHFFRYGHFDEGLPPIKYTALLFLFYTILSSLVGLVTQLALVGILGGDTTYFSPWGNFLGSLLYYPIGMIFSFVSAAIFFVWLYLFKARKGYWEAYSLQAYGATPTYLFGWIPIVNWFVWIWSLILGIMGAKEIYDITYLRATMIYIVPIIIIFVLALLVITFIMVTLGSAFLAGNSF